MMMRIEIEHIHEYHSTEESRIKEMAETAKQILMMKGKNGKKETIKVVMVFDD